MAALLSDVCCVVLSVPFFTAQNTACCAVRRDLHDNVSKRSDFAQLTRGNSDFEATCEKCCWQHQLCVEMCEHSVRLRLDLSDDCFRSEAKPKPKCKIEPKLKTETKTEPQPKYWFHFFCSSFSTDCFFGEQKRLAIFNSHNNSKLLCLVPPFL